MTLPGQQPDEAALRKEIKQLEKWLYYTTAEMTRLLRELPPDLYMWFQTKQQEMLFAERKAERERERIRNEALGKLSAKEREVLKL